MHSQTCQYVILNYYWQDVYMTLWGDALNFSSTEVCRVHFDDSAASIDVHTLFINALALPSNLSDQDRSSQQRGKMRAQTAGWYQLPWMTFQQTHTHLLVILSIIMDYTRFHPWRNEMGVVSAVLYQLWTSEGVSTSFQILVLRLLLIGQVALFLMNVTYFSSMFSLTIIFIKYCTNIFNWNKF